MTVVVTWPKGFIVEPSWYQKIIWFVQDNMIVLWSIFWLLIALCVYIGLFIRSRRRLAQTIIIPLFYPPTNMTPASVDFMLNKTFTDTCIAPEIVHLAVNGYLTIAYDEQSAVYTLLRTQKLSEADSYENKFLSILFREEEKITITEKNSRHIVAVKQFLKKYNTEHYYHQIEYYTAARACTAFVFLLGIIPLFFFEPLLAEIIGFIAVFAEALIKKRIWH